MMPSISFEAQKTHCHVETMKGRVIVFRIVLMLERLWLIPVGFIIGAYGTLIGAGGGFVLVPMLILLYPERVPRDHYQYFVSRCLF